MLKKIKTYHILFCTLFFLSVNAFPANGTTIDSLQTVLQQHINNDDIKSAFDAYIVLGTEYAETGEMDLGLETYEKSLIIAEELDDPKYLALSYANISRIYENKGEYEEAFKHAFRSMEFYKSTNDQKGYTRILSKIASIHQRFGDYEKAYDFQLQALEIFETEKDTHEIAVCLYRIGTIFFYQNNMDMAKENYEQALVLAKITLDNRMIYSTYCALGNVYSSLDEPKKAENYLLESLKLAKEMPYETGISYALLNLGDFYTEVEEYGKAAKYLKESLEMKRKMKDKWGELSNLINYASLEEKVGNYQQALLYLNQGMALARETKVKSRIMEIYNDMSLVHSKLKNYDLAYDYLTKGVALKDSILNESTLKDMKKRNTRYEVQKREAEITLLKKEKEIASLNTYIFIGAAICLFLLSMLLFSRYRVQRKSNELLEGKNKQIHLQNEKLEDANERQKETNALLEQKSEQIHLQNKKLEESNEDLKNFAYVASHDLKEPLRMISSYTSLLNKRYSHLFDETAEEFFEFITDGARRMEGMLDDLLSYSRVNSQDQPKKPINTLHIMQIVEVNLRNKVEAAGGELRFKEEQFPTIMSNRTHMTQLFQNLVSNGLKFTGDKKPIVTVACYLKEDNYVFSVKDNGIGISPKNKEKIFEMFSRLHTRDEYEGTGIGLATCKKIVERLGGQIWVESEVNEGCTFFFSVPNKTPETSASAKEIESKTSVASMS